MFKLFNYRSKERELNKVPIWIVVPQTLKVLETPRVFRGVFVALSGQTSKVLETPRVFRGVFVASTNRKVRNRN
jgi:hypothetical protein